jgi:YspA, cpYpsA-related SLOG family
VLDRPRVLPGARGRRSVLQEAKLKVIVCGSGDFNNVAFIWTRLDRLHEQTPITELMQGGSGGVDAIANDWARTRPEIKRWVCRANCEKYGKAAGSKRNAQMLEWKPDLLVAFVGGRGTADTADMVRQARIASVKIMIVDQAPAER